MPINYKTDIIEKLKGAGYSTYKIRKERIISEGTLQKFRSGEAVTWNKLAKVCRLLNCQPGDLLEYIPDEND